MAVFAPLLACAVAVGMIRIGMEAWLPHGVGRALGLLLSLLLRLAQEWMLLVVARVGWLRCRGESARVGWLQVLGYAGVRRTILALYGRYLLWGLLSAAVTAVLGFAGFIVWFIAHGAPHHAAGEPRFHNPTVTFVAVIFWFALLSLTMCRYALVMPLAAIQEGASHGAIERGVWLMQRYWRPVVLVALVQLAVTVVATLIPAHLLQSRMASMRFGASGLQLAVEVVRAAIASWFVLVRLGLAAQAGWAVWGRQAEAEAVSA